MNKHLIKVKALLDAKKTGIETKKLSASLSDDQKAKLDESLAKINEGIAALEAADEEATVAEIVGVFTQAIEALQSSTETMTASMKSEILGETQKELEKLQAQIQAGGSKGKKFNAFLSLKVLKNSETKALDGYKPYSAGVDVTAWTPEAEIENVPVYHPLIGVAAGFSIAGTTRTSIKLRKFAIGSGSAAVVSLHEAKPVIEPVGSQSVVNVSTYAGVVEGIADEDLEDNAGLEQEVQQEALTNLGEVENTACIALLEAQGQAYANATFGTKIGADERTALAAIVDQVKKAAGTRQTGISFALNSSTWAKIDDLRANASGVPLAVDSVLGDVNRIIDNTLTADNFYCWADAFSKIRIYKSEQADWYKGVQVTKDGANVTAVYSEWRTDEQSLRVRQREVIYNSDDTTIVKGTISGVVTAVTEAEG